MKTVSTDTAWLLFLANLAGRAASTPRVRLWRAMKELGAGALRDGAALLPASDEHRVQLGTLRSQVESDGGTAWLLELGRQDAETESALRGLFDRTDAYLEIGGKARLLRSELSSLDEPAARRRLRQLEREFDGVHRNDFFPGAAGEELRQALLDLGALVNQQFSPREPSASSGTVARLDAADFQGRMWATRRRLWVDRVASAWLIRRFIDRQARFTWLERPEDCPADAVGFDFDGAPFTHVGERVTFEVLLASFGLDSEPGLRQLGRLVHYLDVGGEPVSEAAGFEAVLAGLRDVAADDDALLHAATPVLEALARRFAAGDA